MQLEVQAACIADRLAISSSSPQSCHRGLAVGAQYAVSLRVDLENFKTFTFATTSPAASCISLTYKSLLGLVNWPVVSVDLVVQTAGITQVISLVVSSP